MTEKREKRLTDVLDRRQPNLTVVLENVFDPHNISAVMRTCDAVGIQEIYVLNTIIPKHKKWGARSSSSAAKWLTVHQFTDLEACFDAIKSKYNKMYTTHLSHEARDLYALDLTESVALVFGNEHAGITESLLEKSDGNFIIPQVGMIQSLNISVACAVTVYEAFRQKRAAGHYDQPALPEAQMKALRQEWGFYDPEP